MRDYMPQKKETHYDQRSRDEQKWYHQALPSAITASVSDVSGLEYHAPTDSLLVLSDESKMILEVSSEWRVRDRLFLTAEWSGLRDDIPQPEGIAMDNENNLYIVSEPNLFYKFSCDIQND